MWGALEHLPEWTRPVLAALGTASVLMLLLSIVGIPWLVARLPTDYLTRDRPPTRVALTIGRNVLALILLLSGIAMLVLPGQGLITLLVAVLLADFPGKRGFQRRLFSLPVVSRTLNSVRLRLRKPPLELPGKAEHR